MKNHNGKNKWKYKNLTVVFLSIVLAVVLSRFEVFHSFLLHLGGFGYIGAFIAGALFVSTFTVATSALILLTLSETLSPIEIGLIAGLGAVVGDMLIFRLVKDNLTNEIEDIYNHMDRKKHLKKLFHSKYFNWMLPVLGSIIIASPLPDELGVSLMGISKMNNLKFMLLSYVLNSIGIFLVVSASVFIKP
ncbi:MAG: hypothetical protein A3J60_00400 [Candidatus Pacebacteria bacterium RIFCSPHIGHO2_02_FULL_46_9]|nr:MAG: hypothetical protein A3J60_00400 [Candidatus Pacebacteria bacterium RIFCSPHIGHO2_02_FULL_46_9]